MSSQPVPSYDQDEVEEMMNVALILMEMRHTKLSQREHKNLSVAIKKSWIKHQQLTIKKSRIKPQQRAITVTELKVTESPKPAVVASGTNPISGESIMGHFKGKKQCSSGSRPRNFNPPNQGDQALVPPLPAWVALRPQIVSIASESITACSVPFIKRLANSDIRRDQSRFSFTISNYDQFLVPFMTNDEIRDVQKGIDVLVYNVTGKEYRMEFKMWPGMSVLIRGWMNFVRDNNLNDHVSRGVDMAVWMFRTIDPSGISFALALRDSNGCVLN